MIMERNDKWEILIELLQGIHSQLQGLSLIVNSKGDRDSSVYVHLALRGSEIYLLHKAFIDAGGAPNENYKTLLEKTLPSLANKTQKGFSAQSFAKYSDKVDPEAKDTVKRLLQRMIRNVDSYD
jgi:hypothetical protein